MYMYMFIYIIYIYMYIHMYICIYLGMNFQCLIIPASLRQDLAMSLPAMSGLSCLLYMYMYMCVFVCIRRSRERDRVRESVCLFFLEREKECSCLLVCKIKRECVCVCVCVETRERESVVASSQSSYRCKEESPLWLIWGAIQGDAVISPCQPLIKALCIVGRMFARFFYTLFVDEIDMYTSDALQGR